MMTIISLAAISALFILAEPLIKLKHILFKSIKDYESTWLWRLLNCALCSGFWIGLVFTFDLYSAAIISVLAEFIYKKLTEGGL